MNLQTQSELTTLYNEPHRHYHSLDHILKCLAEYEKFKDESGFHVSSKQDHYPDLVTTSIWWHDAIYNPYSKENEWNSANLFLRTTPKEERHWAFADLTAKIIMATAAHTEDQSSNFVNWSPEERMSAFLVLDIDLSGMGSDWEVFDNNSKLIRMEFAHIPDATFLINRMKFLKIMLNRQRIFYTDYFFNKYEAKARENLTRAINLIKTMLNEEFGPLR